MARNRGDIRKRITTQFENTSKHKHRSHNASNRALLTMSNFISKKLLISVGCVVLFVGVLVFLKYRSYLREKVRIPVNLPRLVHPNISTADVEPDTFWGTYRPHVYFGLKTRHPQSPVVGLMWLSQPRKSMAPKLRHWCKHDDQLSKFGWLLHDGVNFGVQEMEDTDFVVRTEFVKYISGTHGGDWTTRISVTPKNEAGRSSNASIVSLMFYIALDGQGRIEPLFRNEKLSGVKGVTKDLGYFSIDFNKPKGSSYYRQNYLVSYVPRLDKLDEVTMNGLRMAMWNQNADQGYFALAGRLVPRDSPHGPNLLMHQVTSQIPFEWEIVFESGSVAKGVGRLTGAAFTTALNQKIDIFHKRFQDTFLLEDKGYQRQEVDIAKAALSNMLGGIGYFYGSSVVKSPYNEEPIENWPASLHTAVPSRSFFPRGFIWDEGFHNLLISQWDSSISRSIFSHWLDLLNIEGWIPREQILGAESRARVPIEFVVQNNDNANPPTWFLPLKKILTDLAEDPTGLPYVHVFYRRLQVWFNWYNTTQSGLKPGTYRWRGRDPTAIKQLNPLTLTSGLDDYPRASHATVDEYHIDLRCWIAVAAKVMAEIAKLVGENPARYLETWHYLSDNSLLDSLHWSTDSQAYADYGFHTESVKLQKPKLPTNFPHNQPIPPEYREKIRFVTGEPKYQFVKSFGYVNLFPFITKLINSSSPKLGKILNDIQNPQLLWTEYGLRSLAKNSNMYNRHNTELDPPYWRGSIWININYLTVGALYHYSITDGPYKELARAIYTDLRFNIIRNILKEYQRTGYIWEQYDDRTGNGKGTHPFTGWSAVFVLMMAEKYEF